MKKIEDVTNEIVELESKIKGVHDNGLSGILVNKYIKCGKPGCKCNQGYKHGPYPHIQYYKEGILKTIYIRKKYAHEYQEKLVNNNQFRKTIKELIKLYEQQIELKSTHKTN